MVTIDYLWKYQALSNSFNIRTYTGDIRKIYNRYFNKSNTDNLKYPFSCVIYSYFKYWWFYFRLFPLVDKPISNNYFTQNYGYFNELISELIKFYFEFKNKVHNNQVNYKQEFKRLYDILQYYLIKVPKSLSSAVYPDYIEMRKNFWLNYSDFIYRAPIRYKKIEPSELSAELAYQVEEYNNKFGVNISLI